MKISPRDIAKATMTHFRVSRADLFSDKRGLRVARPRQLGMVLCREMTRMSYPAIGAFWGDRDHTTAVYAMREMCSLIASDTEFADHHRAVSAMTRGYAKIRTTQEREWVERLHRGEYALPAEHANWVGEAVPAPAPKPTYDRRIFVQRAPEHRPVASLAAAPVTVTPPSRERLMGGR